MVIVSRVQTEIVQPLSLFLAQKGFSLRVVTTSRRSGTVEIKPPGCVVIRIPRGLNDREIVRMLRSVKRWIEAKLPEDFKPLDLQNLVDGDELPYLGKFFEVHFVENQDVPLKFENDFFVHNSFRTVLNTYLKNFYISSAERVLRERVNFYASRYGFSYNRLFIKDVKTRWGSCSSKRNLSFNWRLVMAPLEVIDYVVVHELTHLIIPNHSAEFWKKVERVIPDYRERRSWLRKHGHTLYFI
ncbi:M48 family metallopeptidase [Fervidobacterium thailandense]|nr:SprT family zinc-dependent metalloprotease [Fervidobacterium thailandense]